MLILLILCIAVFGYYTVVYNYKKSNYYRITKQPYIKMHFNAGLYGEYLTYKELIAFERSGGKFLFNCYLPKEGGNTTEIDLLLICKSGIYVFESKNYSGWIFGKENGRSWTQTLPQGRGKKAHKEHFLNPIYQNKLHIRCLHDFLNKELPVHSVVVFSERCTFKNVDVHSGSVAVVKRPDVKKTVDKLNARYMDTLSTEDIDEIYGLLYPCTQVSAQIKSQHITAIQKTLSAIEVNEDLIQEPSEKAEDPALTNQPSLLICPKCGGTLVLCMAARGTNKGKSFYGCSNFPKCRYIRNTNE